MKETRFIAQNKEKWLESENLLNDPLKNPEKLSNLFTQVVDDLSYSRTYYPNRSVRVYLNRIAREYFSVIYSHHKDKKRFFKLFWLDELPQIVIHCKKQLLLSLFVFLLSVGIGVFSAMKDPQFTNSILGDSYVAMTKENIAKGDPMAVYKDDHQAGMFLAITRNNLMVAFRTYVFGVFLSIGTLAILLSNGIMLGCFQYFFIERGLFIESALSIWLHGTFEISSIILAGGAGLTLGSGLVFPGTYSRLQAFQISAMRSLKLMLGISPIFVLAGIIESFLTRYTEVPDFLKLLIILLSAFSIIGYFVVYPWLKSRKGFDVPLVEVKLPPSTNEPIHYGRIKNNAEIIKDSFLFYKTNSSKILSWIFWVSVCMTIIDFYVVEPKSRLPLEAWAYYISNFLRSLFYPLNTPTPLFILTNTLGSAVILYRVFAIIDSDSKKTSQKYFLPKAIIQTALVISLIYLAFYFLSGWGTLLVILSFLIILLIAFSQVNKKSNLIAGFSNGWNLATANFGQVMGLQMILLLMSFSFLLVLSAPSLYWNFTVLQWNFAETDVWSKGIVRFIEIFIKIFAFNLIIPILAAGASSLYFSLDEIQNANHLKASIQNVGRRLSKTSKR